MPVIDLQRNLIVLQAQVKKGLVTTVTVALLIFCWLMFVTPVPAQAAYSTLTYHLHGEPSLINGANRQLLLSDPNTATTRIQGPRLNTTGEKAIANFETQLGDPNWTGTIPAGTNWTFNVWYSLSAIGSAVSYPRVSVYLNNTVGPPILTATSTVRIANNTTPSLYGWTGSNASAISVTPGDRLFIVVAVNCTAVGSGNQRIQLNIEGLAGGQTDSTIIAPIDESIPQTILMTAPVSADGANGWFKTEPSITLTRDEAGTTYYSWVSATGPWTSYSVPFNAISGINTLYYYSEDASGNIEDVKSQALKVDTGLPSSSVTAPAEGTRLRWASYAVTGTAIETGVSGLSLIEVSINGGAWQPASGTSSWIYAWTLGADGSYIIRSRASDLAGNIETPGTGVTVTVDNTAPTVLSIVPVSGANNVDVGANITTTFDESMDAATITRTTFTLKDYLNNPVSGEVTYDAPSRTASFNPDANLASTTNYTATITAEVKDMTGNALAADQTWSFTSQDIIAPVTTLSSIPLSPDGTNDWFKTVPQITLTRNEPGATYYSWDSPTGPWTTYEAPFAAISGINTLYYYSEDSAGNQEQGRSQELKVDHVSPATVISDPADGAKLRGSAYTITGTASDSGASAIISIEVAINDGPWQMASGTQDWSLVWTLGSDGPYNIKSRAMDDAGNVEVAGAGTNVAVDNTPPQIIETTPANGATNVLVTTDINVRFSEDMDSNTINASNITLRNEAGYHVMGNITYDAQTRLVTYVPAVVLAAASSYTLEVSTGVEDTAGNALTSAFTASFVTKAAVDELAPVTEMIIDPLQPDGTNDWFKTVPQITLTRNEPGATYYSWDSPTGPWTTYEAPFAAISGINTLYYYSEDSAGNQEQGRSQELKVDHVSPATVISDPADGAKLRGSAYTITGTASDSGASAIISIEVAINDGPWQMASGTQDWSLVWTLGSDGPYNIKSRATDDAGNVEVAGAGTNVAVDNTPPQIIETTPAPSRYYESLVRIKDIQGTNHYEGNQTCGVCHGSDAAMPGHELGGDHVSEFTGVAAHDLRINEPDSGTKIKCSNCHEPHGSMFARLTFFDEEELCFQCHNSANLPNSKNGADIQAEFQKTSHHLVKSDDEQTKIECSSCHGPHTVRDQAGQILTNPDNTKAIHSGTKTSFCLKCHDGDPPQEIASSGRVVPYSVKFPVMTNKLFPGWDKLGFVLYPSAMSTVAECSTCHSNHGSGNLRLQSFMGDDSQAYAEEGLCLTCHRTGNPNQAPDIATLLQKSFKHPVDDVNGRHADDESGKSLSYSSDSSSRHSECVDCHDPHEAMSGEAPRPQVKAANNGASGMDRNGQPLSSAGYEYEICFKCHSSFSQRLPGTDDVSSEFDSTNASYHPVASIGANQGIDVSAFVTPWDTNQQLYCSDCHGNDAAGEARCLAGSGNRFMLRDAYGGGQIDLCLKCHNAEAYLTSGMPGSRWLGHNVSTGHSDCSLCHDSHGSHQEHLINRGYFHYQNGGILVTNSSCTGADCHINGEWKSYLTVY